MIDKDTIAVISSPQGQGAISVIRLSGDKTHVVLDKIITPKIGKKKYSDLKINKIILALFGTKTK